MGIEAGVDIGTTLVETAFGWVGLAWSGQGLVGTTLPKATEAEAASSLPAASDSEPQVTCSSGPETVAGLDVTVLADKMRRYFEGEAVAFDEPLDPSIGTEFQKQVWAITQGIPRGQTRTYGQVARLAGRPVGAARAVGQAMARNPWPVIVPCHRVVGHDGRLTGFGGGTTMKQEMLNMEASV
jgi:O-6-methylguanine DNA methyltransferase